MIKNYLKTAFRNLKRNKAYAAINVLGLTVGIAACLLIFLVIRFETSFDNYHPKKDSIYRVATRFKTADGESYSSGIAFPAGPALRLDFPQIKEVASILKSGGEQISIVRNDSSTENKFTEDMYFAEPGFFSLFDFKWLQGSPTSSLTEPGTAVITKKIAEKYFGDWHAAMGRIIKRNNKDVATITGILDDPPSNTDFPLTIVYSYASLRNTSIKRNLEDWVSTFGQHNTYVVLPASYPVSSFNRDLLAFAKRHKPADYAKDAFVAQPLSEIHFDDRFSNYRGVTFNKPLIGALVLIGLFLLLIACVNFINLATAQAVNRSKEVGVRKVLGGNRRQLAFQFLSETAVITVMALILAVAVARLTLPFLNSLLEVDMSMNIFREPAILIFLLITAIVVTLLSGTYPALVLSGFNPITALKSKLSAKMVGGISLRRVLVVLQFGIAHVLIIGTLIVISQMNLFKNASLGFDKSAIINVPMPNDSISQQKMEPLRNELLQNPDIKNVSFSFSSPSAEGNWNSDFKFDHEPKNLQWSANLKWADVNYFKTYNIQFVAGRPYYPGDTVKEFVVNETLVRKLGITDPKQAIGKQLDFWDGQTVGPIVGVVRDFNSYSLREPMAPVVLSTWKDVYQTINIKVSEKNAKSALAFIDNLWNRTFPNYVYDYKFLDDTIRDFYKQEDQLSILYKIFAGIAIFISCLGLYGLVSFMAAQRTKEVGIRKVLGASAAHIVYILSREFSLLIIIAFAIAGPVAWYIMHKWLQNYSYRIPMTASIFIIAIVGSMIIAWLTVGHRAVKAALANPVKSLRTE
jgi:predicted permease